MELPKVHALTSSRQQLVWRLEQRACGAQVGCGSIRSAAIHADGRSVFRCKTLTVVLVMPCGGKSKALVVSMLLCFLVLLFICSSRADRQMTVSFK